MYYITKNYAKKNKIKFKFDLIKILQQLQLNSTI